MKKLISALVTAGLVTTTIATLLSVTSTRLLAEDTTPELRVYCGQAKDPSSKSMLPATLASVTGQADPTVLIIWKSEAFQKFSPQRRCELVSPKFQTAIQAGRYHLLSGQDPKNGVGIICAVASKDESCDGSKMLFTLKSYQNADNTIEQLAYILNGKTNIPLYQSSGGKYVANLQDLLQRK
jgi:Circadian oscillating protein COP23